MERAIIFTCILLLTTYTTPAQSKYYGRSSTYKPAKLKKTHLHFFLHDVLSVAKPTAVRIAGPRDLLAFGSVYAIDDVLTEGPEVVGNARGMYMSSSQGKNLTLVMRVDLGFTAGKFTGSSLSVLSRNPVTESRRELAVVGGGLEWLKGLFL
ncbi:dirigent protein 4-like [Salvia splendens]|uniref:dirigent protein 4-like n=1 Tax=Salvia splendens TaxID=180675 RepID=UPI001C254A16|nr:dirigent protein 4-like [Salvia splendens]